MLALRQPLESRRRSPALDSLLAEMFEQVPDEVMVVDRWYRPLYANLVKRKAFPALGRYLDAHPLRSGHLPDAPPPVQETCYSLIEQRKTRCEWCVCDRAMKMQETVLEGYKSKNEKLCTVELTAGPFVLDGQLVGCIETSRRIEQREIVLDHSSELMKGITETQALEQLVEFLHNRMHYERVRLYAVDSADGVLVGRRYLGEHPRLTPERFAQRSFQAPEPIRRYMLTRRKPGVVALDAGTGEEESLGYWRVRVPREVFRLAVDPDDALELDTVSEIIVVPLEAGSRRWAIFVDSAMGQRFTHDDLQSLSTFARIGGAGLQTTYDHRASFIMASWGAATAGLLHTFSHLVLRHDFVNNVCEPFVDVLKGIAHQATAASDAELRCVLGVLSQVEKMMASDGVFSVADEPELRNWADQLEGRLRVPVQWSVVLDAAQVGPQTGTSLDDWAMMLNSNPTGKWPGLLRLLFSIALGIDVQRKASDECVQLAKNIHQVIRNREEGESKREKVDLRQLVTLAVQTLSRRDEVNRIGVQIRWVPPQSTVLVEVQQYEIFMALLFLMDNALRAASDDPAGFVAVDLITGEGTVTLRIRNNGDHIPAEYYPMIGKEPFSLRADGEAKGTGLGLVLARGWIEAQGGTFTPSYEKETNITTFVAEGRWLVAEGAGDIT